MDKVNKQELRRLAHEATESEVEWPTAADWRQTMCDDWASYVAAANPAAILSLLDELERLEANHNQLNHGVAVAATSEWNRLAEENDQLRAELEQYRKDAERYRWLCEKFGVTTLPCAIERILSGDIYVADGKASIDAIIDAELTREGGANG